MHGYWRDVLARWPAAFTEFVKGWWFWFVNVVPAFAAGLKDFLDDRLGLSAAPWWVLAGSLILSALWAVKLSVEGHYSDLERERTRLGDELSAVKTDLRRRTAERDDAIRRLGSARSDLLDKLTALQQEGISLRFELGKNWGQDSPLRVREWAGRVAALLKDSHPQHFNRFFLKPPGLQPAYPGAVARSNGLNETDSFLHQLQEITEALRREAR
jgi:hypothetical protein